MEQEKTNKPVIIKALENGPLQVKGAFVIKNSKGETIETEGDAYLCRCGQSNNKPFCDGSHKKAGFVG